MPKFTDITYPIADNLRGAIIPIVQDGQNKQAPSSLFGDFETVTYGVRIDTTNLNPETALVYTDDAVAMSPSSGNDGDYIAGDLESCFPWNEIKPCLFKDGAVVGYLKPDNFAEFKDGTPADITSGDGGDVMIEIPKFYYRFVQSSNFIDVKVSNVKQDGFTDWAFSYKGEVKDKFYIGAYLGSYDSNNKLRSLSGKTVKNLQDISEFRSAAQANGEGYEQLSFNKLTALQVLYILQFKNLNSQEALGMGNVDGQNFDETDFKPTGTHNTKGMNYGSEDAVTQIKFNGIEDFWGNLYQWVDGYVAGEHGSDEILLADGNFNDTGAGYTAHPLPPGALDNGGYISGIVGDNIAGFTPALFDGSESTYYSDYGSFYAGCLPLFGGFAWSGGADAGAFQLGVSGSAGDAAPVLGARLLYCG